MLDRNKAPQIPDQARDGHRADAPRTDDEGGLRAPPELTGWRKAWWWFDFIILVKLARLRFIAVLAVIGLVLTQWDTLVGYYDKWMPDPYDMDAAFLLVDDDREDDVQKALKQNYFVESFHLRSSQDLVTLYLNYDAFKEFFPGRKPDFIQGIAVPAAKGTEDGSQ